jgi:APA family basic amino acid/polyamine antiporter
VTFRRKSVAELQAVAISDHRLRRGLSALNLTALGIGAIIGSGIFILTGMVAALQSGPAVVVSLLIAGVVSMFAGLCYAEFASVVPIAGSAYSYAYATLGELPAWIIGWTLVLEYALGAAVVAFSWSQHVRSLVTLLGGTGPPVGNLPAALLVAFATALLVIGVKQTAVINTLLVLLKVAVVLLFIIGAAHAIDVAHWHPFIPPRTEARDAFGWSGVLSGAVTVFFAFIGFDAVSTAAEEARNPQRDIPLGVIGSLFICTVLYVLVAAVATGVVRYSELNVPDPIAVVASRAGLGRVIVLLINIGSVAALTSIVLVLLYGQSRVFYAMARDGLLPARLGSVHPRFRTPHVATLVAGAAVAIVATLIPLSEVVSLVSFGALLAFVSVTVGILVLRVREPLLPRPFKTPAVWFVAPAGLVSAVFLLLLISWVTWVRFVIWLAVGLVIYFARLSRRQ